MEGELKVAPSGLRDDSPHFEATLTKRRVLSFISESGISDLGSSTCPGQPKPRAARRTHGVRVNFGHVGVRYAKLNEVAKYEAG